MYNIICRVYFREMLLVNARRYTIFRMMSLITVHIYSTVLHTNYTIGSHYSLTGNIAVDRQISCWCYGVGCGMSESWWRNQHNKHHSMPQKVYISYSLRNIYSNNMINNNMIYCTIIVDQS